MMQVQYPGDLGASAGMAALWTPPPCNTQITDLVNLQIPFCQLAKPELPIDRSMFVCQIMKPGSSNAMPGSSTWIQDLGPRIWHPGPRRCCGNDKRLCFLLNVAQAGGAVGRRRRAGNWWQVAGGRQRVQDKKRSCVHIQTKGFTIKM